MGLTQRQVATIIGYHTASDISHYEHGHRVPTLVTALKLEIVYRTPVAFLFTDLYVTLRDRLREREDRLREHRRVTSGC
jgi:transcriptional regulator with XRE-family HTH domain